MKGIFRDEENKKYREKTPQIIKKDVQKEKEQYGYHSNSLSDKLKRHVLLISGSPGSLCVPTFI